MSRNTKMKRYGIVTVLVVVCIVLVGLIYTAVQKSNDDRVATDANHEETTPVVGTLEMTDEVEGEMEVDEPIGVEDIDTSGDETANDDVYADEEPMVEVEPIEIDGTEGVEAETIVVESIDEPMAEEPDKPETTPPEEVPETDDDLTDPDVVPEYDEEETTFVPEPEVEEPQDEVRGTEQVPDSENPFLQDNIPSNGNMGEMKGEDYDDGAPSGEGDKF